MPSSISRCIAFLAALLAPAIASAHEVYVLGPEAVRQAVETPSPNPLSLIFTDSGHFALWAMIGVIVVAAVFFISFSRFLERLLGPALARLKPWAPLIARLTFGLSLFFSAINDALFGPELGLESLFGAYAPLVRAFLFVAGAFIVLGFFTRLNAAIMLGLYAATAIALHSYMLTYFNYFGEGLLSLAIGGGAWSLDRTFRSTRGALARLQAKIEPYSFPAARLCFGVAALYASWYAKLFHSNLALDTVNDYHLTQYFHFSPLFLVLGALIVESLIGVFLIIGFEIRFTALFFLFFLTLSLLFFGEAVWPHLILIGLNLAMVAHGYDKYSIEGRFLKREPVL